MVGPSVESMMNQIFTQGSHGWKSPNKNIYTLVVWSSRKKFADVLGLGGRKNVTVQYFFAFPPPILARF